MNNEEIYTLKDPANPTELEQKHFPLIEFREKPEIGKPFHFKVKVGDIEHPMDEEHHIEWIEAYIENRLVERKELKVKDKPEAEFFVEVFGKVELRILIKCNLHGLWENKISL